MLPNSLFLNPWEQTQSCNTANDNRSYWCVFTHKCKWLSRLLLGLASCFPLLVSEYCPVPLLRDFLLVSPLPSDPGDCFVPTFCPAEVSESLKGLHSAFIAQPTSLHSCWSGHHQCGFKASVDCSCPVCPQRCPSSTRNLSHCSRKLRCDGSPGVFSTVS